MASDRLTIAAARPGMRVVCVDSFGYPRFLQEGAIYTLDLYDGFWSKISGHGFRGAWVRSSRLVPVADSPHPTLAALLAERAPEFLAAVRVWHARFASASVPRIDRALLSAIERAGLIAQEPRTTFHLTPQQFQEMHNAG